MAEVVTKPKKVTIARRDWIDLEGNPLNSGDEAKVAGIRYTHLPSAVAAAKAAGKAGFDADSELAPADCRFDYMFLNADGSVRNLTSLLMNAAFGAHTLAGNVVNTATNGPKGDKSMNPIPLIAERFEDIDAGIWAEREGGVGVRYDREKLVQAVLAAKKESDPAPYVAKLDTKVDGKTGVLGANDAKGAISWGAFVLRNTTVKAEYDKLTGGGVSLDQI